MMRGSFSMFSPFQVKMMVEICPIEKCLEGKASRKVFKKIYVTYLQAEEFPRAAHLLAGENY